MIKYIVSLIVLLSLTISTFAGDFNIFGFEKNDKGFYTWSEDNNMIVGICSYKERSNREDTKDYTSLGSYLQFPIIELKNAQINFGVIYPFVDAKRIRPEFSVSYLFGKLLNCPDWIPLEVGAYWAMSPWNAKGFQLGLVAIKF